MSDPILKMSRRRQCKLCRSWKPDRAHRRYENIHLEPKNNWRKLSKMEGFPILLSGNHFTSTKLWMASKYIRLLSDTSTQRQKNNPAYRR